MGQKEEGESGRVGHWAKHNPKKPSKNKLLQVFENHYDSKLFPIKRKKSAGVVKMAQQVKIHGTYMCSH